jgi:hypothetical protein
LNTTLAKTLTRPAALLALCLITAAVTTGCGNASHGPAASSAHAAASSALADPTVSADLAQLENKLLANLKTHLNPAHPARSVEAAVQATFPDGDTARIEAYAVKQFTPAVLTTKGPGSARDTWAQEVVAYALGPPGTATAAAPTGPSAAAS